MSARGMLWLFAMAGYGTLAFVLAVWALTEMVWKIRDRGGRGRHRG